MEQCVVDGGFVDSSEPLNLIANWKFAEIALLLSKGGRGMFSSFSYFMCKLMIPFRVTIYKAVWDKQGFKTLIWF